MLKHCIGRVIVDTLIRKPRIGSVCGCKILNPAEVEQCFGSKVLLPRKIQKPGESGSVDEFTKDLLYRFLVLANMVNSSNLVASMSSPKTCCIAFSFLRIW